MLKDFPYVMKHPREHLGITMQALSRVTMVSVASLYKYEAGERTPTLMVFLRICGALQINPQCFLKN